MTQVHKRILGTKTKISIAVGIATVVSAVLALALFNQQMLTNEKYALYDRGNILNKIGNYTGAITYFDKALAIDPTFKDALNVIYIYRCYQIKNIHYIIKEMLSFKTRLYQ